MNKLIIILLFIYNLSYSQIIYYYSTNNNTDTVIIVEKFNFTNIQDASLNQFNLTYTLNSGSTVNINWGNGTTEQLIADGSSHVANSIYEENTTYNGYIYGDFDSITQFNYTEFDNYINIYDLEKLTQVTNLKVRTSITGHENRSLFSALSNTITQLEIYVQADTIRDTISNLPPNLMTLGLRYLYLYGNIEDIPSTVTDVYIQDCKNYIQYSGGSVPAWSSATFSIWDKMSACDLDSFYIAWAGTAGSGSKTIHIEGDRTINSNDAVLTLEGLGKTISNDTVTVAYCDFHTKTLLDIPSYVEADPNDEMVHPTVVNIGEAWNGYQYYMMATPYLNTENQYENPSEFVSEDGFNWIVPDGVTNPIISKPVGVNSYNADPDLYYENDTLWMIWKLNDGTNSLTLLTYSIDGRTWSSDWDTVTAPSPTIYVTSPSLVKDTATNVYYMYYLKYLPGPPKSYSLVRASANRIDTLFVNEEIINLDTVPTDSVYWHLDVLYDQGNYYMTAMVTNIYSVGSGMYLAKSTDGVNFTRNKDGVQTLSKGDRIEHQYECDGVHRGSMMYVGDQLWYYYGSRCLSGIGWKCQYARIYLIE